LAPESRVLSPLQQELRSLVAAAAFVALFEY
jgi:hypothetical protein